MKYIYAALLLHSSDQKIDEESIKKILTASGTNINEVKVKALVASLAEVNINEAIKAAPGIVATQVVPVETVPAKEEEKEEEEKKEEEEAIAGLGSLFQ